MVKFGLGQAVPRAEDPRLLRGEGRYVADVSLPGEVHAVFLRSAHAHAEIAAIDIGEAQTASGVLAIYTGADVAADGLGDIPCVVAVQDREERALPRPGRPLLARGHVRHVGEAIAMVVAETLDQAITAAHLIEVDDRALPAVATIEDAISGDLPAIWPEMPDHRAFYWQRGDAAAVDEAMQRAHRIIRLDLVNNRLVPCAMEPRGAVGCFDADAGRYTLYTSSQGAHLVKSVLAKHTLKVPEEQIRVVVGDVGGGFGTKIFIYPEDVLTLWAARKLGRPVKWVGERSEAFSGDTHGRDQRNHIEAACDSDGRLLALRVHTLANMGAYLNRHGPVIPSRMTGCMLSGVYAIPAIHAVCEGFYTNTTPLDAYRGAGRPEAAYLIERLMDTAARELGLTPDEFRRRNFVRPDQMPYRTASGPTYDCGDFARNMNDAMAAADWLGFAERRREAAQRDRLRGIGMSTYVEICGFEAEEATVRIADDGMVEVLIGTQSTGQGHETAYAQVVADALDVPFERVRVIQGDTDRIPFGNGTGGSRSLPVGGPAIQAAVKALVTEGTAIAAHLLQAEEAALSFADGRFTVAGSQRGVGLFELAAAAREPENVPPGRDSGGLAGTARYHIDASTFPNGCHICEIEIDPETGFWQVVGYWVVDDFGTIVNPLLLAGQIHGGVVQGIGQALLEEVVYDRESGQLITGSFLDYAIPHAVDMPSFQVAFNSIPCTTNPMGIKGAGEAGTIGACPAVINAVIDALAPLGVRHIDMPATQERIWRAIRQARAGAA